MGGVVKGIGKVIGTLTGANRVADAQERANELALQTANNQMTQQKQQAETARVASSEEATRTQEMFERTQAEARAQREQNERMQAEQNARAEAAKLFQTNLSNISNNTGNTPTVVAGGTAENVGSESTPRTRKRKVSLASNLGLKV